MAGQIYKGYLRLCEKWGVDVTKKGRDLGEAIRQQVAKEFSQGEATHLSNLKECEKKLESLNRLASNYYGNKYKRGKYVSTSNLTLEQCREVLSTEGLKRIEQSRYSFFERLKLWIRGG